MDDYSYLTSRIEKNGMSVNRALVSWPIQEEGSRSHVSATMHAMHDDD